MKKMLFVVLAIFCTAVTWAARVTSDIVQTAASNWLNTNAIAQKMLAGKTVKAVRAYDAEAHFYIVDLAPQGHILVAGSDLVKPILSFAKTDFEFPEEEGHPYAAILGTYVTLVTSAEEIGGERHAKWTELLRPAKARGLSTMAVGDTLENTSSTILVEPFLTTHYTQGQPYNDFCPLISPTSGGGARGRVPCGCTATAFGQIFYYWQWPAWTDETKTYVPWFTDSNGVRSDYPIQFDGHERFQWELMRDYYPSTGADLRGVLAESVRFPMARLFCFIDSIACMRFQAGGSAAPFETLCGYGDVPGNAQPWYTTTWRDHFRNHAATAETRAAFIKDYIEPDLLNGQLIPLTIPNHAIVADGIACNYEEDEYYLHVNYGWGGSADNWYAIYTVTSILDENGDQVLDENGNPVETVGYSFTQVYPDFRPLKMLQVRKIPATYPEGEPITLEWAIPNCYTNTLQRFEIQEFGSAVTERTSFTDDFSKVKGSDDGVTVVPYDIDYLSYSGTTVEGTYTYPDSFAIDAGTTAMVRFSNQATAGQVHVQVSADGENWTSVWSSVGKYGQTDYTVNFQNYLNTIGITDGGTSVKVRLMFTPLSGSIGLPLEIQVDTFSIQNMPVYGASTIAEIYPDNEKYIPAVPETSNTTGIPETPRGLPIYTYTIKNATPGQHIYKIEPIFSDDFKLDTNPSVTVTVDAAYTARPVEIQAVMSSDTQRRRVQEGFYRECAAGGKNLLWVQCSENATELKATSSHQTLIKDEDIQIFALGGGKFAVEIDASKITENLYRSRLIVTLHATNGTFSDYKDLSLRFSGIMAPEEYVADLTFPTGEYTGSDPIVAIEGVQLLANFKGFNDLQMSDEDGVNELTVTTTGGVRNEDTGAITIGDRAIIIKNSNYWSGDEAALSILLKYSNLQPGTDPRVLMTTSINAHGAYIGTAMTADETAIAVYSGEENGLYGNADAVAIPESGYLLMTYSRGGGLFLYSYNEVEKFFNQVLNASALKMNWDVGQTFSIGGTPSHARLATGMVVEGIAIYRGEVTADNNAETVEVYTNATTPTTVDPLPDENADAPIDLDWTPGSIPISNNDNWLSAWEGDEVGEGARLSAIGPYLSADSNAYTVGPANFYAISSVNPITRPYTTALSVKQCFTLMTYGCVDFVQPAEGQHAILWDMGRMNNAGRKLLLVKSFDGHVRLFQATGMNNDIVIEQEIDVGELKGYHLITVRFDKDKGTSVQIDNNTPVVNANLHLPPGTGGIQIGNGLGGNPAGFVSADNFIICKMLGLDTTIIPQYEALCEQYPAITEMPSFDYNVVGGTLSLPSLIAADGQTTTVTQGTLKVAKGSSASLGTVTLAGDGTAINVVGGSLTMDSLSATATGSAVTLTDGGTITYETSPNAGSAAITKKYGFGTVTGTTSWTDKDTITLTDAAHGTTFYANGVTQTYTGTINGGAASSSVKNKVNILTENNGKVVFTGDFRDADVAVTPGSALERAEITDLSTLTFFCRPLFGGNFNRPTGDWVVAWDAGSYTTEGQKAFVNMTFKSTTGKNFDPLYPITDDWHPTKVAFTPKESFSLAIYGCADFVKPTEGHVAVLWSMGSRNGEKLALVKDSEGNIKLIQATGATINKTINAGPTKGYHFFIVRFDATNGASLQIDLNGEVHTDTTLTTRSDAGFSIGSVAGGCPDGFELGYGFPMGVALAVDSSASDHATFNKQVGYYSAATEISTDLALTADNTAADNSYYLPSFTFTNNAKLSVTESTLVVPAGVEATLNTLEVGTNAVVNVSGGTLTMDALVTTASNAVVNVTDNGTLIIKGTLPTGVTVNVADGCTCTINGEAYPPPEPPPAEATWAPTTAGDATWETIWTGTAPGSVSAVTMTLPSGQTTLTLPEDGVTLSTLTLNGAADTTFVLTGGPLTTASIVINTDTDLSAVTVSLGALTIAEGVTLTIDLNKTTFTSMTGGGQIAVPTAEGLPPMAMDPSRLYTWTTATTDTQDKISTGYYTLFSTGERLGPSNNTNWYWTYFCHATNSDVTTKRYTAPGNILRFTSGYKVGSFTADFAPLTLGGLIVEEGAISGSTTCAIGNGDRATEIGDASGVEGYVAPIVIRENFTFSRGTAGATFRGVSRLYVAEGKTLSFASSPVSFASGATLKMEGEGQMAFGTFSLAGGTLDVTDWSFGQTNAPLVGTLTLDATTGLRLPTAVTFDSEGNPTWKLATAATAIETPILMDHLYVNGEHITGAMVTLTAEGVLTYTVSSSICVWTGGGTPSADGSYAWNDAANWQGGVPESTSLVEIDVEEPLTITLPATAVTVAHLTLMPSETANTPSVTFTATAATSGITATATVLDVTADFSGVTASLGAVVIPADVTVTVASDSAVSGLTACQGTLLYHLATATTELNRDFDVEPFAGGTIKVTRGNLVFDNGNNGGGYPKKSAVVISGSDAKMTLKTATDTTGYEAPNANKTLTIENGATLAVERRDTFSMPLILKDGKVTFSADSPNNERAFDFYDNSTLTSSGESSLGRATIPENATISDLVTASGIVWIRRSDFPINVINGTLKIYSQMTKGNNGTPNIIKNGAGTLELFRAASTGYDSILTINEGTVRLNHQGEATKGDIVINANGTLEVNATTARTIVNDIEGAGRLYVTGDSAATFTGDLTGFTGTLGGDGTIASDLTFNEGMSLDATVGALTVTGAITYNTAMTIAITSEQATTSAISPVPVLNKAGLLVPGNYQVLVDGEPSALTLMKTNDGIAVGPAVAQINGTTYASWAEALATVADGTATTIDVVASSNQTITIPANKNVTLRVTKSGLTQTGAITVEAGATLTLEVGDTYTAEAPWTAKVTNNGTLYTRGHMTLSEFVTTDTLTIETGTLTVNGGSEVMYGDITIEQPATLKAGRNWMCSISGENYPRFVVKGTLNMAASLWTIHGDTSFKLYSGATVTATTGTLQFNGGTLTALQEGTDVTPIAYGATLKLAGNATIDVAKDVTLNITGVISQDGTRKLSFTGSGTTVLSGANTYSGGTDISEDAKVNLANASGFGTGSVTGTGNVIITTANVIPTGATNSLTAPLKDIFATAGDSAENGWRGTVTLRNITKNEYANLTPFGNPSSTLELDGYTGYFQGGQVVDVATLKISKVTANGSDYGFHLNNGNSDNVIAFDATLTGDGPITMSRATPTVVLKLVGQTDTYTGDITLDDAFRLVFAETTNASTDGLLADAQIAIARDDVKVNGTWSKTYVKKTISGSGKITGALTFADGATLDATEGALTATGTVSKSGALTVRVPVMAAMAGNEMWSYDALYLPSNATLPTENVNVYAGKTLPLTTGVTTSVIDGTDAEGEAVKTLTVTVNAEATGMLPPTTKIPDENNEERDITLSEQTVQEVLKVWETHNTKPETETPITKISEVVVSSTPMTTTNEQGESITVTTTLPTHSPDAANLFTEVVKVEPTLNENDAPTGEGIATITYDFGIHCLTVKVINGERYVVFAAKVKGRSEGTTYAEGTRVVAELEVPDGVSQPNTLEAVTEPAKVGEAAFATGERWFRIPLRDLPEVGTYNFKVQAEK